MPCACCVFKNFFNVYCRAKMSCSGGKAGSRYLGILPHLLKTKIDCGAKIR